MSATLNGGPGCVMGISGWQFRSWGSSAMSGEGWEESLSLLRLIFQSLSALPGAGSRGPTFSFPSCPSKFGFGGGLVPKAPEGGSLGTPRQERLSAANPFSRCFVTVSILASFDFATTCLYLQPSLLQYPKRAKLLHVRGAPTRKPLKLHPSAPVALIMAKDTFEHFALSLLTTSLTPSGIFVFLLGLDCAPVLPDKFF